MAQLLGFVYAFFLILSSFGTNTKQILKLQTISFFFKAVHYYLLGGLSGFLTSIISLLRNLVFYKIKKSKMWTVIFILIYIIITIFAYNKLYSVLPALATIFYTLIINKNNPNYLRYGMFITIISWLTYNICIVSYSGIIVQIVILVSNIMAIIKLDKRK